MSGSNKVEKILNSIKLSVDDITVFEKDIESILGMFDTIKAVEVNSTESSLQKKKISLNELRKDEPKDSNFKPEVRGTYYKVPNVSKKK